MAVFFEDDYERILVPNWRSFARTVNLGELQNTFGNARSVIDYEGALIDKLDKFYSDKNLASAAEVINTAVIWNDFTHNSLSEVVSFIVSHKGEVPKALMEMVHTVVYGKVSATQKELDHESISDFFAFHNRHNLNKIIRSLRLKLNNQPRNPILWIELARNYSLIGLFGKAEKCIEIAMHLGINNRYVIRSACRFFAHIGDFSKARFFLRKSSIVKTDPWVMASAISLGLKQVGKLNIPKRGKLIIENQSVDPYQFSELSSSIATLELRNGSNRRGRQLFKKALIKPNDNSLAQAEWATSVDSNIMVTHDDFLRVENAYEAYAMDQLDEKNYQNSLAAIEKWFLDMPYSIKPIVFGSYITCGLLGDYKRTIKICEAGLIANPNSPEIINNIAYSLCRIGKPDQAAMFLNRIDLESLKNENKDKIITLTATAGLIAYKTGYINKGRELYEKSIEYAKNAGKTTYVAKALGNQILAELELELPHDQTDRYSKFKAMCKSISSDDCKLLEIKVDKEYNKKNAPNTAPPSTG
jgi:tetratricopeptide (TPR) repeat protein